MTIDILWRGPTLASFSIGEASRNYIRALLELGCRIKVEPAIEVPNRTWLTEKDEKFFRNLRKTKLGSDYLHVNYSVPHGFKVDERARVNIGYFPIDYSQLQPEWIKGCEGQEEFWVPSLFNVAALIRAGFDPSIIWQIPHGVDPDVFKPGLDPLPELDSGRFRFLAVSQYLHRKGWDTLIQAFCQEFGFDEPVELVIKTGDQGQIGKLADEQFRLDSTAQIHFHSRPLPPEEMPRLFCSADALVLCPRMEAWGMPFTEAMACGLPVIGPSYAGPSEYITEQTGYKVPTTELYIQRTKIVEGDPVQLRFAEHDVRQLRRLLRHVYEHRDEARKKGIAGREKVVNELTWLSAARKMLERLETHAGQKAETVISISRASAGELPVSLCLLCGENFELNRMTFNALTNSGFFGCREVLVMPPESGSESMGIYGPDLRMLSKPVQGMSLGEKLQALLESAGEEQALFILPDTYDFAPDLAGKLLDYQLKRSWAVTWPLEIAHGEVVHHCGVRKGRNGVYDWPLKWKSPERGFRGMALGDGSVFDTFAAGCFLADAQVLRDTGGFDERFYDVGAMLDLGRRLKQAGHLMGLEKSAWVKTHHCQFAHGAKFKDDLELLKKDSVEVLS